MTNPRAKPGPKRKAQPTQRTPDPHRYDLPPTWQRIITAALQSADLHAACRDEGVTLDQLTRAASQLPDLDAALGDVRTVVRLSALHQVEARAAAGDPRALRAMTDGTLERLDPNRTHGADRQPPHVAAAMIAAALAARQAGPDASPAPPTVCNVQCPACAARLAVHLAHAVGLMEVARVEQLPPATPTARPRSGAPPR